MWFGKIIIGIHIAALTTGVNHYLDDNSQSRRQLGVKTIIVITSYIYGKLNCNSLTAMKETNKCVIIT